MSDDRGVIGDLWLYRQSEPFQMAEIRLVQQVANQCAIAIRQARLYQAAQAQVTELERLNRLKDDFLNTVSHEMRTPMSSIKMAIQMLEISLESGEDNLAGIRLEGTRASRYFKILQDQCDREIGLINNLLDLSRLEAGGETLSLSTIEPHGWLAQVVEPFIDRTRRQQQRLTLAIEAELPKFSTDLSKLERIVTELLNNACKYTPAEQEIELTVRSQADTMLIFRVTNSGVQLDPVELTRIFDKFYRIPRHDPWNHGGTGLGLALVKKLVAYLGGWIQVGQGENQIWFQVELPSLPMEGTVAVKKTPD
jgi:signal transduction histidine kinase